MRLLGWSVGKKNDIGYDENGTFHLLCVEGDDVVRKVCGSRGMTAGQVEKRPYGRTCRRCEVQAQRLNYQPDV